MADSAGFRGLTRRGLGKLALSVSAGGLSLIHARSTGAVLARTVYVFDPIAELATTGANCATCAACRRHAAHKVFASIEMAETRRAHPHCRCAIKAVPVSSGEFARMFGEPDGPVFRGEFDVRWTGVMGGLEMPA